MTREQRIDAAVLKAFRMRYQASPVNALRRALRIGVSRNEVTGILKAWDSLL